jgi:streptogramin lyase
MHTVVSLARLVHGRKPTIGGEKGYCKLISLMVVLVVAAFIIIPPLLAHAADLFVASKNTNSVLRYDGQTGDFIEAFVPSNSGGLQLPRGIVFGPDGHLYVSDQVNDSVLRYHGQTGIFIDAFIPTVEEPQGLIFGPDTHLYVASVNTNTVIGSNGLTFSGLNVPRYVAFGPDDNLYVSDLGTDSVRRYNRITAAFIDSFVSPNSGGLDNPVGLLFGPDGHLYVSSSISDSILRYDGQTGDFIDVFVSSGSGGLDNPEALIFGPDGNLYVGSRNTHSVLRYDGQTGDFIDTFVTSGSGGLNVPHGLAFEPSPSQCEVDLDQALADLDACLAHPIFSDEDGDGEADQTEKCPGTPADAWVDDAGCSQEQFCLAIDATTRRGRRICEKSDWQNNEPLKSHPGDCTVDSGGPGTSDDQCVAK